MSARDRLEWMPAGPWLVMVQRSILYHIGYRWEQNGIQKALGLCLLFFSSLMGFGRRVGQGGSIFWTEELSLTSHSLLCGRVGAPVAVVLSYLLLISEEAEDGTSVHGNVSGSNKDQGQRDCFICFRTPLPAWLVPPSQDFCAWAGAGI